MASIPRRPIVGEKVEILSEYLWGRTKGARLEIIDFKTYVSCSGGSNLVDEKDRVYFVTLNDNNTHMQGCASSFPYNDRYPTYREKFWSEVMCERHF